MASDRVTTGVTWCGRRLGGRQYDVCRGRMCGYYHFREDGSCACLLGGARPRPKLEDADTDHSDESK